MSLLDCRDNAVSTNSHTSLDRLEAATTLLHGFYGDPLAVIDKALAEDPQFVMGHAFRAGLLITASDKTVEPMLKESVEAAEALVHKANDRERRHIAAARAWLDRDFELSVRRYGDIVIDHPRDSVALQIAHLGDFFLGQATMLRDRVAQVLPHWDESTPGFGFVLGMYAFGLEETNLFQQAEDTGRRALALNRRDPWAIHAVTHVMEMQGRQKDGIEWLTSRVKDWSEDNMFAVHQWWHLALLHLDLGEIDEVLKLYDSGVRGNHSAMSLDLVDASAMLWRLQLRGIDIGDRWKEIADICEEKADTGYYAFNDTHAMMAFVGNNREHAVRERLDALTKVLDEKGTNVMMTRDVGLPLSEAIAALGRGDYATTIERLIPIRAIANRFGGSNAQRDLIHLTLLEAAFRAGRVNLAQALAAERIALKPSSPFNKRAMSRVQALIQEGENVTKTKEAA
ncbi:MAG TPA: tetratricopeptide repeat protein [Burkholderiales bacterium]|jgi:tetratricopeptide (TPR) repeat protein|nr:tetratricopeptide repeat protein [Burkholderiales bacterium]